MRVAVIGAGPAGLYFAALLKKTNAAADITVFERNRSDDTFGFGVVFSDQTLDTFEKNDPESYRMIRDNFAYWDDIEIRFRDNVHRIGGNGFCGCSRRTLLLLLQQRCRQLGVAMQFETEITDDAQFADYDLVVIGDGSNSRFREKYRDHFGTELDLRPNKFTWMGSTRPFDAFTYLFRENAHGIFIAHCYQYEPGASTWVLECQEQTWRAAGLDQTDEAGSARYLEDVFAEDLQGHKLMTNRSLWRNFPTLRNKRWVKDNMVLVGDAKATAHFTIGSGTKLAMEDAIALHRSFLAQGKVADALKHFESSRRGEVERTQHAADTSLVWFEHIDRFWQMDPVQFSFGLMTRAKAITYDNLRLRAPDFVAETDAMFARETVKGGHALVAKPVPPMFQPLKLRGLTIENRAVVSPMCMYSAKDGVPGDFHLVHYGARAQGGPGLIFTEMTCIAADARITPGCAGLWNDEQEAAWKRIVDFTHASGQTKICLQLGHAGRKGATKLMWDGMDRPLAEGAWPIVAASPLPYYKESQVPQALDRAGMDAIIAEFAAAARRGIRAGFDMIELHAAHGYLLASFLSPLTNHRGDEYGGNLENRLRFPLEVFCAMRAAWPEDKPMSVRLSATDWQAGGITGADSVVIARAFADAGADLIDVSSGQTTPEAKPVYGRMFQTPFAEQIRNEAKVAVMAVGSITGTDQINTILAAGRADLVALGRPHLADPAFTLRAAAAYGHLPISGPTQYADGRDALFRQLGKEQADLNELRLKAKPKRHAAAPAKRAAE